MLTPIEQKGNHEVPGRIRCEWVVGLDAIRWSYSMRMGGRTGCGWVAVLDANGWSDWMRLGGRIGCEWVAVLDANTQDRND